MANKSVYALAALVFLLGSFCARAADSTIHGLSTNATSPLPSNSCIAIDQGPGTDAKLCSGYAAAFGAPVIAGNNSFTGANGLARCTITKIGTTFTPTCQENYITIDAGSETIANPSFSCPSGANCSVTLYITYNGAFFPTLPTYAWTNLTAPVQCSSSVTSNCLMGVGSVGPDIVACKWDGTTMMCGPPLPNVAPPSAFSVTASDISAYCGGGGVSTCVSATLSSVASGTTMLVVTTYCHATGTGCGATNGTQTVSAPTKSSGSATIGTCTAVTGAAGVGGNSGTGNSPSIALHWCNVTGTGSLAMSCNMSANTPAIGCGVINVVGMASSPDDGKGNFVAGTDTTPVTVPLNGLTTQSTEFIFGAVGNSTGTSGSPPAGWTLIAAGSSSTLRIVSYQISGASGSSASMAQALTASGGHYDSAAIIAAFKHP